MVAEEEQGLVIVPTGCLRCQALQEELSWDSDTVVCTRCDAMFPISVYSDETWRVVVKLVGGRDLWIEEAAEKFYNVSHRDGLRRYYHFHVIRHDGEQVGEFDTTNIEWATATSSSGEYRIIKMER